MSLTPLDIHNKEFTKTLRGFNPNEVNEFLDRVVKDYEDVIKKNIELKEEVEKLNSKIEHYHKMEETLHNAIVVAQETADEVKQNSHKEAEVIKKEAESDAQRMIDEAQNKANKIQSDIEELKKQAHAFRARFRSMIEAQLEMLESDDLLPNQVELTEDNESEKVAGVYEAAAEQDSD